MNITSILIIILVFCFYIDIFYRWRRNKDGSRLNQKLDEVIKLLDEEIKYRRKEREKKQEGYDG